MHHKTRPARQPGAQAWRLALAIIIFLSAFLSPAPAEGAGFVSDVVPFVGIFSAFRARNRVYRTANSYIDDKREYYDRLREKAREQLASREISGLRKSQVAAYVKLVGLVEGERAAMINFAESEKRAAREQFLDDIGEIAVNRLLASGIASRALGALSNGANSSQSLIDQALDELSGGGSGALEKIQRVRRIAARVTVAGGLIGGSVGEKLQVVGGTIVQTIDKPTAEIEAGLEKVQGDLADLQSEIADLQARGVQPTSSQVTKDVAIRVVTGEEGDPAVEAIVSVLSGKIAREGGTFRDRARSALIGAFVARCAVIGERYREAVARLEGEAAGEAMSEEQASAPCNAIDLDQLAAEAEATSQVALDEESGADSAGDRIELLSATVSNGFCWENQIRMNDGTWSSVCDYDVSWELAYETMDPPVRLICHVVQVSRNAIEIPWGKTMHDQAGMWSTSIISSGWYPDPGVYVEQIVCELRAGDTAEGELLHRIEQELVVDITTVRPNE